MLKKTIRIATRSSPLARWQARHVADKLMALDADTIIRMVAITTTGDRIFDLRAAGGKNLFVKELEAALLNGEADIAVHSLKDMPASPPEGLLLGAVLERADPRDLLISNSGRTLMQLPKGARLGTASLRRRCQLLALRPDLEVVDLRGNVGTRLGKVHSGELAATVLAKAGVERLALEVSGVVLSTKEMLPAAGQGTIGIECRANDDDMAARLNALEHIPTRIAADAERCVSALLYGGCQLPLAVYAKPKAEGMLNIAVLVGKADGSMLIRKEMSGSGEKGAALAMANCVAEAILDSGGREILDEYRI